MKFEKLYVSFTGYPQYVEIWKYEIQDLDHEYLNTEYLCRDLSQCHSLLSKGHLSALETMRFQEALTNQVHMETWDEEYVNPDILDGMGWDVGICLSGQWKWHHGMNAFPDEWKTFCNLLKKYRKVVWPPRVLSNEEAYQFINKR